MRAREEDARQGAGAFTDKHLPVLPPRRQSNEFWRELYDRMDHRLREMSSILHCLSGTRLLLVYKRTQQCRVAEISPLFVD